MLATLVRLISAPPLRGRHALLFALGCVAIPAVVRVAVYGTIVGCEFTPFLPFVFLSAIFLRPWQAAGITLTAVAILGGLFHGPAKSQPELSCFTSAAAIFLASSALMIGAAWVLRRTISILQKRGAESTDGVIFSLENGEVWASWHGQDLPVRLGSQKRVSDMMKDFLAHANDETGLSRRYW